MVAFRSVQSTDAGSGRYAPKSSTAAPYAGTVVTGFAAAFVLLAGPGKAEGRGSGAPFHTTEVDASVPAVAGLAVQIRSGLPAAEKPVNVIVTSWLELVLLMSSTWTDPSGLRVA